MSTCGLTEDEIERQVVAFDRKMLAALTADSTCRGVSVALFLGTYNKKYGNGLVTDTNNAWSLSFNLVANKNGFQGSPFRQIVPMGPHSSHDFYQGEGTLQEISNDVCAIAAVGKFSDLGAKAVPKTSCPNFQVPEDYEVPDGYVRGFDTKGMFWDIPRDNAETAKKRDPQLMLRDGSERDSWSVAAYSSGPDRWTLIHSDRSKHRQFRYIISCDHSNWGNEESSGGCNLPVGTTLIPDSLFGPVTDVWEHELAGHQEIMIRGHCFGQTFQILTKTVEPGAAH